MILLIDNYDSFTYNLYQYLSELGADVRVRRNDAVTLSDIRARKPSRIVLSPGPGRPEDAGICLDVVKAFAPSIPILGVCLGHQVLASAFGGKIVRAARLMHGKTSAIRHDGRGLYRGVANPFMAVRYHSLVAQPLTLPRSLTISARTVDGVIMGLRHKKYPSEGVQYHPESLLTGPGKRLLKNFLGKKGR